MLPNRSVFLFHQKNQPSLKGAALVGAAPFCVELNFFE